jgi:hypothetical protein
MKKILILISALSFLFGVSSCDNSILNHKGSVIVDKKHNNGTYRLVYRYKNSKGYYVLDGMNVIKYEYDSYNIGDTVK